MLDNLQTRRNQRQVAHLVTAPHQQKVLSDNLQPVCRKFVKQFRRYLCNQFYFTLYNLYYLNYWENWKNRPNESILIQFFSTSSKSVILKMIYWQTIWLEFRDWNKQLLLIQIISYYHKCSNVMFQISCLNEDNGVPEKSRESELYVNEHAASIEPRNQPSSRSAKLNKLLSDFWTWLCSPFDYSIIIDEDPDYEHFD